MVTTPAGTDTLALDGKSACAHVWCHPAAHLLAAMTGTRMAPARGED
jgi:hypothetical protein